MADRRIRPDEAATVQKRANEALITSEMGFRAIIDVSPGAMVLSNKQRHITFLNPEFVQTSCYAQQDIPTLVYWWTEAYPGVEYVQWLAATWSRPEPEHAKRTGGSILALGVNREIRKRNEQHGAANVGQDSRGNEEKSRYQEFCPSRAG